MTFELHLDGRDVRVEAEPFAPLSEVLRAIGVHLPAHGLVLVDDALVRASDVPALHAEGSAIRTPATFVTARFSSRFSPLLATLPPDARDALLAAGAAVLEPDVLAEREDPTALVAAFAPPFDVTAYAAQLAREAARANRPAPRRRSTRTTTKQHRRPAAAARRRVRRKR